MLKIKNTLTGKIENFEPLKRTFWGKSKIGMYNCGPTVYSKAHIGNLRAYIFADLIRRTLEFNGYRVKQVINITDVGHLTSNSDEGEDKIEEQAKKENLKAKEITQKYTDLFFSDLDRLNIDKSKILFPKATEHIKEQIDIIKKLEKKGFTYKISDGIYFDTLKFKDYGKLGKIDIKGLEGGARIEVNKEKRNSTDFALWKFTPRQNSRQGGRQQEWKSPWGIGFPGWHLECSAMSMKYLGETFDIHTGGIDHINTHHNNEIAQSESATGKALAKYWMHVNHIQINGEKISKSIGNVVYLDELESRGYTSMSYKYLLLTAHYSTLLNYTEENLRASQKALFRIYSFLLGVTSDQLSEISEDYYKKFKEAINDDLNTAKAIAIIFELLSDKGISNQDKKTTILKFNKVLNLGFDNPIILKTEIPEEVLNLANERLKARKNKDFVESDKLREKIKHLGFEIKDVPEGFKLDRI